MATPTAGGHGAAPGVSPLRASRPIPGTEAYPDAGPGGCGARAEAGFLEPAGPGPTLSILGARLSFASGDGQVSDLAGAEDLQRYRVPHLDGTQRHHQVAHAGY